MPADAIPPRSAAIAVRWQARGFSCDTWIDPPGRRWEDYIHDTDELLLVLEGEMELVIDGQVSHPQAGEEIFIPAGVRHSVRNLGHTQSRWLYGYRRRS